MRDKKPEAVPFARVVTFGGPWFVIVEPLPAHIEALRLENAKLRGSLSDAKDALRSEVDRRAARIEREDLALADRRAAR